MPTTEPEKCLDGDCCEDVYARGLCAVHYRKAKYRLNQTGATWEDLEKAGLALPRGRKRLDDFDRRVVSAVTSSNADTTCPAPANPSQ